MRGILFTLSVAGCIGAPAAADLVGVKIENVTSQYVGNDPNTLGQSTFNTVVFELYANFDSASDKLLQVFNANVASSHAFYHALNGDGEAQATPLSLGEYAAWGSEVDSFVTLGYAYGGTDGNPGGLTNNVKLDPNFDSDAFLSGATLGVNPGWFVSPPTTSQGVAGTYPDLKILLGRFSYVCDPADGPTLITFAGSLRLTYLKGGTTLVQPLPISFGIEALTCVIPTPGAFVVLLGLAGGRSRRRG